MAHAKTVIDCREQCRKFEAECQQRGDQGSKCQEEERRCERACIFK
jgi:hypothetical protein